MNQNELHSKLMAAARKHPPSEQVPYAFEKRITSRLAARARPTAWSLWSRPLWQAALSCIAITVLCGVWAYGNHSEMEQEDNFSQDFEAAVFAPVSEHIEDAW